MGRVFFFGVAFGRPGMTRDLSHPPKQPGN